MKNFLYIERSDGSVIYVGVKTGKKLLLQHKNWRRWEYERDGITPYQIMCPVCNMIFRTKRGLMAHRSIHL